MLSRQWRWRGCIIPSLQFNLFLTISDNILHSVVNRHVVRVERASLRGMFIVYLVSRDPTCQICNAISSSLSTFVSLKMMKTSLIFYLKIDSYNCGFYINLRIYVWKTGGVSFNTLVSPFSRVVPKASTITTEDAINVAFIYYKWQVKHCRPERSMSLQGLR